MTAAAPQQQVVTFNCTTCDEARTVPAGTVRLDIHADYASAEWDCPSCGQWGSKAVSDPTLVKLLNAGCVVLHDPPHEYGPAE